MGVRGREREGDVGKGRENEYREKKEEGYVNVLGSLRFRWTLNQLLFPKLITSALGDGHVSFLL